MKHLMQENQNNKKCRQMAGAGGNRIARSGSLSDIWFVAGEDRVVCGLPVHHPYSMYLCGGVLFSGSPDKI